MQDVKLFAAFDLKCVNAVLGLSGHVGKRACLWCEGLRNEECGKLTKLLEVKIIGMKNIVLKITQKSNMQHYMNMIIQ